MDGSFLFAKIQSAVAYYRMGDVAKANTMFQKMVQQFPNSPNIRYYYGEILLDQRDIENSIQEFKEATKLNPSFALPLLNRVCHVRVDHPFHRSSIHPSIIHLIIHV